MSKHSIGQGDEKPFINQILELTVEKLAKEKTFPRSLILNLQEIFETNSSDLPNKIIEMLKSNSNQDEDNKA